jgi:ergothioneine biosynthesis protein EgtB
LSLQPEEIVEQFLNIRRRSEALCAGLAPEDYVVQPTADVSPPKWHLGHTSWFFEELLLVKYQNDYKRYDASFAAVLNSYYKSAGSHWLQSERGHLSRPTVAQIYEYRAHIDRHVAKLLSQNDLHADLVTILEIGLHHEQQHQELLLMDIKVILAANPCMPAYSKSALDCAKPPSIEWSDFDEGVAQVGHDSPAFSFDNERPRHKSYLTHFSVCNGLVSNGEYLEFVNDGGYQKSRHWLSMGWDWHNEHAVKYPLYWFYKDGQWFEFTLHGAAPLDLQAPLCHVSYFEANAYANWRGCRLPTEQELELFLIAETESKNAVGEEVLHPGNSNAPHGQLWCWTQSQYSPYPGYQPYDGMLEEYNGKFMCNQFVLRGGCFATPKGHYRHSYRNFFQPHQRWMFSGIRLARDLS